MIELLNKNNIVPAKYNAMGEYEHLRAKASEMLSKDIAYNNIAKTLKVSHQVVANLLNVHERY